MNSVYNEFENNLKQGVQWGTTIGGLFGGMIAGGVTALLLGIYNAWVQIKDNDRGGKDINAGIDGKNEKLLLQKIANDYFGQVGYAEIENPVELQSAIENFDKEVWEKYCKAYNLTYSAIEEEGANGKIQTKINVSENKARDLEKVFKAYANEMQSRERTKTIQKQWELTEYKAKEKGLDIQEFKNAYEKYPQFKETINATFLDLNEKQKNMEIDYGANGDLIFRITDLIKTTQGHSEQENILIKSCSKLSKQLEERGMGDNKNIENSDLMITEIVSNNIEETEFVIPEEMQEVERTEEINQEENIEEVETVKEKISESDVDIEKQIREAMDNFFTRENILGDPDIEKKIGNQTFKEHLDEVLEKPEVKEQIEQQEMDKVKNRSKGELDRG